MPSFDPRTVRVGFVVDEVASGQIFLGEPLYSFAITIPPLPLAHSFIHSFTYLQPMLYILINRTVLIQNTVLR